MEDTDEDAPQRLPVYGPLKLKDFKTYFIQSKARFDEYYEKPCPYTVKTEDFDVMSVLGKGAFGKVLLVRRKRGSTFYAMKALQKRHIINMKQVGHALNEKRILQCIDFPFGVRMEYFCKDNSYIYFFMPFISGGEMFWHLQKLGRFKEDSARFFAAQVALGLEYLHHLGLVYRDLKPENLLFDHYGYLKITDFGFTKPVTSRTYTFCGTPHYLAPEVITGHGYGHSVDWWSFGVLVYEMNAGYPPFEGRDQMTMFRLILQNRYVMPSFFSNGLKDILHRLLETDLTRRYGNLKGRADDIKSHEWFRPIDWLEVFNRRVQSPFIPSTEGEGDTTYFNTPDSKKHSVLRVAKDEEFKNEFKDF